VASPLSCIFTLWLERTGDAFFLLIPPKAITSSIFLDFAAEVGVEKCVTAIRDVALTSGSPFLRPSGEVAEGLELLHPSSREQGERIVVSFAAQRGEGDASCL
jgi:hypothetical protein